MLKKIFTLLLIALATSNLFAQDVCLIKGKIENDSLRFSQSRVKKVILNKIDEYDRFIPIDSVKVKKGNFKFKCNLKEGDNIELFFITGFDNGSIPVFVEPGEVNVQINKAAFPADAIVEGTKNNDLYKEYKAISKKCVAEQNDSIKAMVLKNGNSWMDTKEAENERLRIGAKSLVGCNAERLNFLLDNNSSPLAPLMLEREFLNYFTNYYAEIFLRSVSPDLKNHPYYKSLSNQVKSKNIKVGAEMPDITLPLLNGEKAFLSNFKGKYIVLDFWATWCAPCLNELPNLVELYNQTVENKDKFVIISFALDKQKDEDNLKNTIKKYQLDKDGWIHASDFLGWDSPARQLFGVEAIPRIFLIDPEGRLISSSLSGKELIERVKQILSGDLYYQEEVVEDDKK